MKRCRRTGTSRLVEKANRDGEKEMRRKSFKYTHSLCLELAHLLVTIQIHSHGKLVGNCGSGGCGVKGETSSVDQPPLCGSQKNGEKFCKVIKTLTGRATFYFIQLSLPNEESKKVSLDSFRIRFGGR
jgi:hypothetical protein